MTLLELLVGITLGLLVIGAAIGTLLISRQTSGTVSEVSQLQQQASFALRVIGQQLRQAGALELTQVTGGVRFTFPREDITDVVSGTDGPDTIRVVHQPSIAYASQRDCIGTNVLGQPANVSLFSVDVNSQLRCANVNPLAPSQPVISNVADFQIRYRVNRGTTAAPIFQLLDGSPSQMVTPEYWQRIVAVEICLDLQGTEPIPDAGATYTNCQGATAPRNNRTHFVSRNVFNLRRQNLLEIALP